MRIRPIALSTLALLTGLLAVAPVAQAAPQEDQQAVPLCYVVTYPKAYTAACLTALFPVTFTVEEVKCLLNTAPVNWVPNCTTWSIGPIPIVDYALCYYNTAPANWAALCV